MITPLDIQNKVFTKGLRGYKEEEVDGFLDLITLDLEKLLEENQKLKVQIKGMNEELQRYRGSEATVLETLQAAKALMSDISVSSEKRASVVLKNAELDAELIQKEARENVERLNEEHSSLRRSLEVFRTRYKALLESELDKFDMLSAELFPQEPALSEFVSEKNSKSKEEHSAQTVASPIDTKTITNLRTGE